LGPVRLYRAIAERAGLADPYGLRAHSVAEAERITIAEVTVGSAPLIAVMNRSWEQARLPSSLRAPGRFSHVPVGDSVADVLGPKQVLILDASSGA
jgi:hypothetical protein